MNEMLIPNIKRSMMSNDSDKIPKSWGGLQGIYVVQDVTWKKWNPGFDVLHNITKGINSIRYELSLTNLVIDKRSVVRWGTINTSLKWSSLVCLDKVKLSGWDG